MRIMKFSIPHCFWIMLPAALPLAGCVVPRLNDGAAAPQTAAAHSPQSETRVFEYQDLEDCLHVISLSIRGVTASGKVVKLNPASPGVHPAKFSGRVFSGAGPGQVRIEVRIEPGGWHNVDYWDREKCIWILQGNQLKVPMALPIGRTGFHEVIAFHEKS